MLGRLGFLVVLMALLSGLADPIAPANAGSGEAAFVSQLLPDQVSPGERFKVIVQFRNDGQATWKPADGYRLVPTATVSGPWKINPVALSADAAVLPGNLATFAFELTAPATAGAYELQWQLSQAGRTLGNATPAASLLVGEIRRTAIPGKLNAEFVSQTVPSTMFAGETYRVMLIFKNTGGEPWRHGEVTLHPDNPLGNLNWFIDRVELAGSKPVAPGEIKVFEFDVRAPTDPGTYPFQWRLMHPKTGPFGDRSEAVTIRVEAIGQ